MLVVGAGAVGQVFAWHLAQGGAALSFFVRPQHLLPEQLPLFLGAQHRVVLEGFGRLTSIDQVRETGPWQQVWLTVPSTRLSEPWLPQLLAAAPDATFVALAPEGEEHLPAERRVVGAIPFMAWQTPLPGETHEPGVACWFPPLARVPFSGGSDRVKEVIALAKRGGLATQHVADTSKLGAPFTALLMASVAALEGAGWALRDFRGTWPELAARAAREVMQGHGDNALWSLAAHGWFLRAVMAVGAKAVPFNLEAYLRFHFTKVGEQSRVLFREWVARGRARGTPTVALEQLLAALEATAP